MAALTADLQARWNTRTPPVVRCTPGLFPTPGFFIEATIDADRRTGIVGADGSPSAREIVPFARESERLVATEIVECATVDLDGDGVDEIVETWRRSAAGIMGSSDWLGVRRLANHTLVRIDGPHTSVVYPDLGGCAAEVQLAGLTIVITVVRLAGIAPTDCLSPGVHTFALDHDKIVEIDARLSRR